MNFLYDDIVHVLQNTTDSCINSATDRRGYVLERKLPNSVKWQGRLHKGGEWCEMHHGESWGECCDNNDAFARVYNNLLLYEYIYYFTPVHF